MNVLWALVPVKEINRSKQRLAGVLAPVERQKLVLAMLRDVLSAIGEVNEIDGVLLVSRSQKAHSLARDFVSDIMLDSVGSDHSRAVMEGNRFLRDRYGVQSSLAISGDVPRVTSDDIRQIINHHECVTLVPNATGEGTNAVLTSPPNVFTYQFGGPSLERHVASAEAAGLTTRIVQNANIGHDIDDVYDLKRAIVGLGPSFTGEYLKSSGIAARLTRECADLSNVIPKRSRSAS